MAMTTEKIREAFAACRAILPASVPPMRGSADWREHLVFMCEEGSRYADQRREKAMRWLGFVQGSLWARGLASIEDLKNMNRSDPQRTSDPRVQCPHGGYDSRHDAYQCRKDKGHEPPCDFEPVECFPPRTKEAKGDECDGCTEKYNDRCCKEQRPNEAVPMLDGSDEALRKFFVTRYPKVEDRQGADFIQALGELVQLEAVRRLKACSDSASPHVDGYGRPCSCQKDEQDERCPTHGRKPKCDECLQRGAHPPWCPNGSGWHRPEPAKVDR